MKTIIRINNYHTPVEATALEVYLSIVINIQLAFILHFEQSERRVSLS